MTIKNIPVGYKDSPLGIIPMEWEVKRLGEVCNSISSGNNKERNDNGDYPVYGSTGLIGYSNVCIYDIPQILVARVGAHAGYVYCVDGNYDVSDNTLILNLKSTYHFDFAYNQLLHYNLNRYIFGSGQPLVTAGQLKSLRIPLPPLAEQEKIAEILSTWDKAIERQTQLIQKLELRKKGLMQQLLTGKKRLPGFTDEWKKVKAGLIFKSVSIRSNKQEILLSATQEHGVIPRDMLESRVTMPTGDLSSFKLVDVGDFVISLRSFEGGIEYSQYRGVVSPAYTVLKKALDVDSAFYKAYFKSNDFIQRLSVAVIGIRDGKQISYSDFAYIKIPFPALQEQTAIANILSSSDEEIRLAQDKLAAMKEQKKGLMQVLLTGKRRIIK